MTPNKAQPCRSLPTIRPNTLVSAAPMAKIDTIWSRLVSAVGFSRDGDPALTEAVTATLRFPGARYAVVTLTRPEKHNALRDEDLAAHLRVLAVPDGEVGEDGVGLQDAGDLRDHPLLLPHGADGIEGAEAKKVGLVAVIRNDLPAAHLARQRFRRERPDLAKRFDCRKEAKAKGLSGKDLSAAVATCAKT